MAVAMVGQLDALKTAVIAVDGRARDYVSAGRLDAAEACYESLMLTLQTLFEASGEPLRGWQRAAYLAANLTQRIAVDALASSLMGEYQMRVATLLDLPEVTTITSMDEMYAIIAETINVGAPRYNSGDLWGCCTVYWGAAQTLVAAPATRGFAGYTRAISQLRAVTEAPAPPVELDNAGVDEFAWTLRRVLDSILKIRA